MGMSRVVRNVLRWRWTPAAGLISAALAHALFVARAVPSSLWDLPSDATDRPTTAPSLVDVTPSRTEEDPTIGAAPGRVLQERPKESGPFGRRGFSPAVGNEETAVVEMVPSPLQEPPPVPDPPALPPSVQLAELVSHGLIQPGDVEFVLDPTQPIAGQVREAPPEAFAPASLVEQRPDERLR
jgi:hypothetical protein